MVWQGGKAIAKLRHFQNTRLFRRLIFDEKAANCFFRLAVSHLFEITTLKSHPPNQTPKE